DSFFFSLKVSAADGAFLSRKVIYFKFPLSGLFYKIQTNDSSFLIFKVDCFTPFAMTSERPFGTVSS
ncbi:MAG: hypothetical protein LBL79_07630, partial [Prevotella sp.]|nr:hypothetical protein [Prevotella sp.]